jgi:hypothetical protein
MGQISKNAFKKLLLLYFIGKFKNGVYSSYRVQKVFYFGVKGLDLHPFTFRYTEHGQYSKDIRDSLDSLAEIGLVEKTGLQNAEEDGTKWAINSQAVKLGLTSILAKIDTSLARSLDVSINENGYLKNEEIFARAHNDPLLKETPPGHLLFSENIPDYIEVNLSEDECENLELSLNEKFMVCMDHLVEAFETVDFDMGKVWKVESIL